MTGLARQLSSSVGALAAVFRNPGLARLELAKAAMSFAEWAFAIALGVYAFDKGGAALVGIAALVRLAPGAVASPFAGLIGDRHSRRNILLASLATGGAVLIGAAVAANLGAGVVIVVALAALFTIVVSAYIPAEGALLPILSRTPQELSAANVAHSVMDNVGFLAGALISGALLTGGGPEVVFGLAGAVALFGVALVLGIGHDQRPEYVTDDAESVLHETALGLRELVADPQMRLLGGALTLLVLFEGAADVFAVIVPLQLLDLGQGAVGWLNAAWGLGAIAGGAALAILLDRGKLAGGVLAGSLILGAAAALPAIWPAAPAAYLGWIGVGLGYTFTDVASKTLLQRLGSDETLGRVLGSLETAKYVAMGLGSIAAPALIALFGIRGALIAFAALLPVLGLLRWAALRRLDAGGGLSEREFGLVRADPIFEPLPVATIERLGHALVELEVAAGVEVIVQGDEGDRFYLIEEGGVDVLEGGTFRRHQGPGTSFGEIALLHEVPRTASVVSTERTRLLSLDRDSFVEAVTGRRRSHEAVMGVMEERLSGSASAHLVRAKDPPS